MGAVFLGRERELAELSAALDALPSGRGYLALLTGEPGIGKTRLADEVGARAAARGWPVHWGRCWEGGGAPAFFPWAELVATLAAEYPPPVADREALAAIGADVSGEARAVPTPSAAPDQERFRIFRAVAALLGRAARSQPRVVVLDDLHAADRSSLLLLRFLGRELRALPVLILGTFRDVEVRLDAELSELLAQIGRDASTLHLGRLVARDVAALVHAVAGDVAAQVPPATIDSIFEATQGNPLFVDEVARTLLARGELVASEGAPALLLPFGVREAIRQHLARLPDGDRPILEVASVLGGEARGPLLAAAVGAPIPVVQAALERAVALGVLVERGRHRFAFGHGLLREALYRDMPNSRRMATHARVAEALERDQGEPDRPWAQLAHHLLEAGPAFVERAVAAAVEAAARALAAVAYDDALELLARAAGGLDLLADLPRPRAELCLAESLVRARIGEVERGRSLCLQAAQLARGLGDSDLLAQVALGYGDEFAFGLVDPRLVALLREALAALPAADGPLRSKVMARLASALQPAPRPEEPVALAREAIEMARRLGDRSTLLAVLHAAMAALMDYVPAGDRLPLNTEAARLAAELGDRPKALRAHARLVCDHVERGELTRADAHIAAHDELGRELRSPRALWQTPLFRAMRAVMEGRFAEGERLTDEAEAIALQGGAKNVQYTLALHRLGALRAREDHAGMDGLLPDLIGFWDSIGNPEWHSAIEGGIHARLGRRDEAAAALRRALDDRLLEKADCEGLSALAETCVGAGDAALATVLYARIAPLSAHLCSWGMTGLFCEGPFDRQLGLLAALRGQADVAGRHFEAAATRCRQLGLRPHLARVLFEHARAALEGTATCPPAVTARDLAIEARALARDLGQSGLLAQLDALDASARLAADLGPAAAGPSAGVGVSAGVGPATAGLSAGRGLAGVVAGDGAAPRFELRREGDYWTIASPEGPLRLKDTRGVQTLHRLVSHPDREFHVTELAAAPEATSEATSEARSDLGDAGELLDRQARAAYRARLDDLDESLRDAESFGDIARAQRANEERAMLAQELARAVGLGGRERRAGSAAERARVTVQKRLKDAIRKIEEGAPALGRHLTLTVQTGHFCAYRPGGRLK